MYVRDWMTANVLTATPQMSVLYVRCLLDCHGIRHLPVMDGERLVGMVSARDVRLADPALAASLTPLQSDIVNGHYRPVEMIMSQPVRTVSSSATLATAAELMLDHGICALPVVDDGRLVGILTTSDCLRAIRRCLQTMPADGRTAEPLTTPPGDDRQGKPATKLKAHVVNPDNYDRAQIVRRLESAGYKVVTCQGPKAGVLCPAILDPDGPPCLRLPADLDLIIVDPDSASPDLLAAYRRWAPQAELQIVES
jgi:acetoin utilization protein AcuB